MIRRIDEKIASHYDFLVLCVDSGMISTEQLQTISSVETSLLPVILPRLGISLSAPYKKWKVLLKIINTNLYLCFHDHWLQMVGFVVVRPEKSYFLMNFKWVKNLTSKQVLVLTRFLHTVPCSPGTLRKKKIAKCEMRFLASLINYVC